MIKSFSLHQLFMITNFHNHSLIHHHDLVSMTYRAEPMGNDDNRSVLKRSVQRLYNLLFINCIQGIGCLIKEQILRIPI